MSAAASRGASTAAINGKSKLGVFMAFGLRLLPGRRWESPPAEPMETRFHPPAMPQLRIHCDGDPAGGAPDAGRDQSPSPLVAHPTAPRLVPRPVLLRLDHAHLLAAALLPGLPARLLPVLPRGFRGGPHPGLQPVAELPPRQLPVRGLRPLRLAPHLDARRPVSQPHRRGRL